jgi:hypothetical protein
MVEVTYAEPAHFFAVCVHSDEWKYVVDAGNRVLAISSQHEANQIARKAADHYKTEARVYSGHRRDDGGIVCDQDFERPLATAYAV